MQANIDIRNVILKTERLTLRGWTRADLADLHAYASVEGVYEKSGATRHKTKADSLQNLLKFIDPRQGGKGTFALEHNATVIGSLSLKKYKEWAVPEYEMFRCRELGFVLAKDYWGRGLMTEAVQEVIRYVFHEVEIDALFCSAFMDNIQSLRVQEKCGFKFDKQIEVKTQSGH